MRRTTLLLLPMLLIACDGTKGGDDSASDSDPNVSDDSGGDDSGSADDSGASDDSGGGGDDSGGAECVDNDGDGYGADCDAGPDCDDNNIDCNEDCSDSDGSGQPDCAEGVGADVFLYTGGGGGGGGIDIPNLLDLYGAAGYGVMDDPQLPPNIADRYGVMIVLAPTQPVPRDVFEAADVLLARGGRVVLVTEAGTGAHHVSLADLLSEVGSSMSTQESTLGGPQSFTPATLAPLTDGVSAMVMVDTAHVDPGQATVIGQDSQSQAIVAHEDVKRGDVVVVCDGDIFGPAMNDADNAQFLENLADLD